MTQIKAILNPNKYTFSLTWIFLENWFAREIRKGRILTLGDYCCDKHCAIFAGNLLDKGGLLM